MAVKTYLPLEVPALSTENPVPGGPTARGWRLGKLPDRHYSPGPFRNRFLSLCLCLSLSLSMSLSLSVSVSLCLSLSLCLCLSLSLSVSLSLSLSPSPSLSLSLSLSRSVYRDSILVKCAAGKNSIRGCSNQEDPFIRFKIRGPFHPV